MSTQASTGKLRTKSTALKSIITRHCIKESYSYRLAKLLDRAIEICKDQASLCETQHMYIREVQEKNKELTETLKGYEEEMKEKNV